MNDSQQPRVHPGPVGKPSDVPAQISRHVSRSQPRRRIQFGLSSALALIAAAACVFGLIRLVGSMQQIDNGLLPVISTGMVCGPSVAWFFHFRGRELIVAALLGAEMFFFGFVVVGAAWIVPFVR